MSDKNPRRERDLAQVQKHLDALSEHFDSALIFVTRNESGELGGTVHIELGNGNWFTRFGQVQDWLIRQEEFQRIKSRKSEDE